MHPLRETASFKGMFSFLLKGERFLFLKKRNKRHCGRECLSGERRFPVHPACNEKTDGSHTNRPFCMARWLKRQQCRIIAFPQMIFFCEVGLHGKAGAQARRTRAETRRRREAYPCGIPTDDNAGCACVRPSEGLRFPRKPTVFSSRKKRRGRFLFLKKRNKRHCGRGCLSEKRRYSARPACNEKTDGSHTNRPFCVTR